MFQLGLGLGRLDSLLLHVAVRRLPHVVVFHDALQGLPRQLQIESITVNLKFHLHQIARSFIRLHGEESDSIVHASKNNGVSNLRSPV